MKFLFKGKYQSFKKNQNIKLEFDYLSSENLLKFQNSYFDYELIKKNINKIQLIENSQYQLKIEKIKINDE